MSSVVANNFVEIRGFARGSMSLEQGKVPVSDASTTTWAEVVELWLRDHSHHREFVWRLSSVQGGEPREHLGVLGIDVPLSSVVSADRLYYIGLPPAINYDIPYEQIKYALACHRRGLAWPLWKATDVEPHNQEVLGAWNAWRKRNGATVMPRDKDNSLHHLVGIRSMAPAPGGLVSFFNVTALLAGLSEANSSDVLAAADIALTQAGADKIRMCAERLTNRHTSADPECSLLPIIVADGTAIDRAYGTAFSNEERDFVRREPSELEQAALQRAKSEADGNNAAMALSRFVEEARPLINQRLSLNAIMERMTNLRERYQASGATALSQHIDMDKLRERIDAQLQLGIRN